MSETASVANPDLTIGEDNKARWNQPDHRRHGFHNLHRLARYGLSFRAAHVMALRKRMDLRIADMELVHRLTSLPWFSAMVVVRNNELLFERYAPDFGPDRPHSIQSISKTTLNLVVGRLLEDSKIDLTHKVARYLPWIGSGYAEATVQQVLNMDVANDYSEDYSNSLSTTFSHEEAMGWRLPADLKREHSMRSFLATINSPDITNRTGCADYKSANTDVLAMIVEAATGRPMRSYLADIADASGIEGGLYMTTDREGFPTVDGGICFTARDLARYGSLFVRRGRGIDNRQVGSASFIESTLHAGVQVPAPRDWLRYSNQTYTDGRWLGHGGYGGQYMIADLTSGVVGVFLSVLEDKNAYDVDYYIPIIKMLSEIGRLDFDT
ncbi:serine hydrolase domain-containing protein [Sinorhizobium meliloti]|uniref:serine hydrolase domain-containing protein n=1 Tax=Rhizobium meliloti TaxID=382 RepID=UPI00129658C4|nr:serine hydrolase [Sinorhizobium meliloti]MQW56147.1 serine hydrolase [Sinorhizobium meliloti]